MLNSNQGLGLFRQTQSLSRHKQGFHHLNLVSSVNPDRTYILEKKGLELVTSLSLSCKTCLEKFLFWSEPLKPETVERKEEKGQNNEYLRKEKSFLEEIKNIFQFF